MKIFPWQNGTNSESEFEVDENAVIIGDVPLVMTAHLALGRHSVATMHRFTIGGGDRTSIQDHSWFTYHSASTYKPEGYPLSDWWWCDGRAHANAATACTVGSRGVSRYAEQTILDGAVIEERKSFIGAGSLVPPGKRLESGFMYMGRQLKKISVKRKRNRILSIRWPKLRQAERRILAEARLLP